MTVATPLRRSRILSCSVLLALAGIPAANGDALPAPTAEQEAYWWQDEIRLAAWSLSTARAGRIAQWPRMTVQAGSATLPLPPAAGPVMTDGSLDEDAWKLATTFPVGPIFGPWREGPFTLQVSVCRREKTVYLAIESPVDLTELGTLGKDGELLRADKPYRVGAELALPIRAAPAKGPRNTIELALPLSGQAGEFSLEFPVELIRRSGGELPPQFVSLGLSKHSGPVWLAPIAVRFGLSDAAVRLEWEGDDGAAWRLSHRLLKGKDEIRAGQLLVKCGGQGGVAPYRWEGKVAGAAFHLEGFQYAAPVLDVVEAARSLQLRAARLDAARADKAVADTAVCDGRLAELETLARNQSSPDRPARRRLYCEARQLQAAAHRSMLDSPLLFVKRHPYFAAHIYDDFYTWHPGGGIYVIENPGDPGGKARVRALIDAHTRETLGAGVYRDPDISWDARRLVFAYKPESEAVTSIYEIGLDGRGLRRLTQSPDHHDVGPCYLPDGRIVFLSTRPRALVPCFNSGVATLHTMDGDGANIRSISVNNVNEFDPAVLPDGRILYGRWEYVDKTALYMQSLWTVWPDGRMETSLYGNNLAKPTAILDARPVPAAGQVMAALTPHNGQAVGAIALINPRLGKENLAAIANFTPEYPTEMDQGLRVGPSDPWPLSPHDAIISNNAIGEHGVLELIDRFGNRDLVHCDPEISCYAPMLIEPRAAPPVVRSTIAAGPDIVESPEVAARCETAGGQPSPATGRFFVQDVYQGLDGVSRGEVTRLRIVEETARTSGIPPGGRWWNQAFLVSWQGAYVIKNVLGTVPVHADGSAYFEVPSDRAVYFEALDAQGREVQRMRTFVQAAEGVTRSCIGCHEREATAPVRSRHQSLALRSGPSTPTPESWGSGLIDYPTNIQPILDRHCVRCHGGEEGIAGGMDFSGGWTWAFNLSYETLLKHNLAGFLRCHNSDVASSKITPPRTLGSGSAPLADLLLSGHEGRIPEMSASERALLLAWMDTNSNYYGTWDYTPHAVCDALTAAQPAIAQALQSAGCTECHPRGHVGNDWVNLQRPEWSRILRAPLAESEDGLGLGWCRERKAPSGLPLVTQQLLPPDVFHPLQLPPRDDSGSPHITFASTGDPRYQGLLKLIQRTRAAAMASPRVDMPGAEIVPGVCRRDGPVALLRSPLTLDARWLGEDAVRLSWPSVAAAIGLRFEVHRGAASEFTPNDGTFLGETTSFRMTDVSPPSGQQHYALVAVSGRHRAAPLRAVIDVPHTPPPAPPQGLAASPGPGEIQLLWLAGDQPGLRYHLFRKEAGAGESRRLNQEPLLTTTYLDSGLDAHKKFAYAVRAVDRRGRASDPSEPIIAAALPMIKEPVFTAAFQQDLCARTRDDQIVRGAAHGGAKIVEGVLDLKQDDYVTFPHQPEFDLRSGLSVECWLLADQIEEMPVVLSCGRWRDRGWFLQIYQRRWRWHVGGVDCDGGKPPPGGWTHVLATFDGKEARLYQDGEEVARTSCYADLTPWPGPLCIGQYSSPPSAPYQVTGRIAGVKIYRRAVRAEEAAAACHRGGP